MFYVLKLIARAAVILIIMLVIVVAWKEFSLKVIHDGAWRGPLTQSHIHNEKWYRTDWDESLVMDPVKAIYSVLVSVVGALLTYDIPKDCDLRLDEFLANQLVAWIREYGDKYGISSPAIVFGKYYVAKNGEWIYLGLEDYALVTCIMDLDRYGLAGMTREVRAIDLLYPYAILYPDITADYKITRKFLRHIWSHLEKEEYTIMLNPSTDTLEYWARKAVGTE